MLAGFQSMLKKPAMISLQENSPVRGFQKGGYRAEKYDLEVRGGQQACPSAWTDGKSGK